MNKAAILVLVLALGCAQPPQTPPSLAGTSWQLVKFQGGDDTLLRPDDKSKVHPRIRRRRLGQRAHRLQSRPR